MSKRLRASGGDSLPTADDDRLEKGEYIMLTGLIAGTTIGTLIVIPHTVIVTCIAYGTVKVLNRIFGGKK